MKQLGLKDDRDTLDDNSFDIPDTPKALKCKHGFAAEKTLTVDQKPNLRFISTS